MLRATATRSPLSELVEGSFQTVVTNFSGDDAAVTRLVLATGKVGHEAEAHRASLGTADHVAIARVEQIYPWPADAVATLLERFTNATEIVWLQEEPENMGAWPFVHQTLHRSLADTLHVRHVTRAESASPATGSSLVHAAEQADLLRRAIG
jgi:2-oxoglutarate dehydrogenase E1 component